MKTKLFKFFKDKLPSYKRKEFYDYMNSFRELVNEKVALHNFPKWDDRRLATTALNPKALKELEIQLMTDYFNTDMTKYL